MCDFDHIEYFSRVKSNYASMLRSICAITIYTAMLIYEFVNDGSVCVFKRQVQEKEFYDKMYRCICKCIIHTLMNSNEDTFN